MGEQAAKRVVVFGATGHLGQELIERLEDAPFAIGELVGVVSPDGAGKEFLFQGEDLDVLSEWPALKGWDIVFICTPPGVALEIVRDALRAEVPCIDCTGVLAEQEAVPMPLRATEISEVLATAPVLAVPSATSIAWAPILERLDAAAGVSRVVATVLSSASALGRRGLMALSEESIALFNQSEEPEAGPAGQTVAFDVIPGGAAERRVAGELARSFGEGLRVDVSCVQVPTFVGEGVSLAIELAAPLDEAALEKCLDEIGGLERVPEGFGSRGLAPVEEDGLAPAGPTLRDAASVEGVLVGRVRADRSLPAGQGWRLWLAFDPLRMTADHAMRLAQARLGAS